MKHGSLFSGIGGFELAAEWMGWDNVFHCEWNEFGKKVLKYYWPNAVSYDDITKTDFTIHRGGIDILTGGFPCQPYSMAGKRLGKEDDRHLWPEMLRTIKEVQPRWVVGENVLGLINWNGGLVFDEVQADLEAAGYEVWPYVLPAVSVNAPHRRDRVWFVAHRAGVSDGHTRNSSDQGLSEQLGRIHCEGIVANTKCERPPRRKHRQAKPGQHTKENQGCGWANFPTQSPVCGRDDGFSSRLDGITFSKWRNESIKAYGNAIVPQVVFQIFKAIEAYERL
jgi:DNA (cytosine-5)-methyltransferase 1